MDYKKMYMHEVSAGQPTFSLGRPMNRICPMVGGGFSSSEAKPPQGGVVQDFQCFNQYPLDVFRKGGMDAFQYESYSDSLLMIENQAIGGDRTQIMHLNSPNTVVHAHAHAETGFGSSNKFPCATSNNRFIEKVRQINKRGIWKRKNDKAKKKSVAIKGHWSGEEDRALIELMRTHDEDWAAISTGMNGSREGKQCRERWNNHLKPHIKKEKEWTEDEYKAIVEGHRKHDNKWVEIAKNIPGRTENSVKNRWHRAYKKCRQSKHSTPSSILEEYITSITQNSTFTTNNVQKAQPSGFYVPVADNLEVLSPHADQGISEVIASLRLHFLSEENTGNVMPSDVAHLMRELQTYL